MSFDGLKNVDWPVWVIGGPRRVPIGDRTGSLRGQRRSGYKRRQATVFSPTTPTSDMKDFPLYFLEFFFILFLKEKKRIIFVNKFKKIYKI